MTQFESWLEDRFAFVKIHILCHIKSSWFTIAISSHVGYRSPTTIFPTTISSEAQDLQAFEKVW